MLHFSFKIRMHFCLTRVTETMKAHCKYRSQYCRFLMVCGATTSHINGVLLCQLIAHTYAVLWFILHFGLCATIRSFVDICESTHWAAITHLFHFQTSLFKSPAMASWLPVKKKKTFPPTPTLELPLVNLLRGYKHRVMLKRFELHYNSLVSNYIVIWPSAC